RPSGGPAPNRPVPLHPESVSRNPLPSPGIGSIVVTGDAIRLRRVIVLVALPLLTVLLPPPRKASHRPAAGPHYATWAAPRRGAWVYSTQIEAYVPATGALALLAAWLLRRGRSPATPLLGVAVSLLLTLCILYHQSNVFICVPLAYWLVGEKGGRDPRRLWILG